MNAEPFTFPCVKCGSTDHYTQFHTGRHGTNSCQYLDHNATDGEHLHHHCRGCGYDWTDDTHEKRLRDAS